MALLPRPASVAGMWRFWIAVALIRIPVAYLLTRSVGWALPAWFSHYSLYESSAGFGPSVLALIALDPTLVADILPPGHSALALYSTPILAAAFAWLENSAWTYGIAIALTLVLAFITRIPLVHTRVSWLYPTTESDSASDEKRIELAPPRAYATPPSRPAFLPILGSLSVLIPFFFISPTRLPFPDSVGPNPLLHVLFLSFPRPPSVEISQTLLTTTLDSFTPHMSGDLSISVFTHATSHPALENVRADYPDVEFFVDRDSHPDDNNDQYLHLAEAFRWAEGNPAEWVMLVEDDFPICPGGWDVIATTMNMLERDRKNGIVRAGFIGTGGR